MGSLITSGSLFFAIFPILLVEREMTPKGGERMTFNSLEEKIQHMLREENLTVEEIAEMQMLDLDYVREVVNELH